jgi:hypothetical protein
MNVKEILHRDPPPILYHYTTQQGLLGIINAKEIWASHTQYLNDVREFRHALDLVREELTRMQEEPQSDPSRDVLEKMRNALSAGIESINVCICSFSARGDVLSQWRAYSGQASGFAVGFSGDYLRAVADEHGWLVPIQYEEHDQRHLVRTLLQDVLEENLKRDDNDPDWKHSPPSGNLTAYLNRYAPILKHKSFEEEQEWRIITRPLACTGERFSYREGTSMLVPYFRLPLGKQKDLGIKEIVVGPTPFPEQSRRSVIGLLVKNNIEAHEACHPDGVKIRSSEVPFRSW